MSKLVAQKHLSRRLCMYRIFERAGGTASPRGFRSPQGLYVPSLAHHKATNFFGD
jgi:hypothetical protein